MHQAHHTDARKDRSRDTKKETEETKHEDSKKKREGHKREESHSPADDKKYIKIKRKHVVIIIKPS